jgi:hypothetical protein
VNQARQPNKTQRSSRLPSQNKVTINRVVRRDANRDWYFEKFHDRVESEIVQLGIHSNVKKKQYRRARKKGFDLMWAHYVQNHEGYILGFRADHEFLVRTSRPVVYSPTRPAHDPAKW